MEVQIPLCLGRISIEIADLEHELRSSTEISTYAAFPLAQEVREHGTAAAWEGSRGAHLRAQLLVIAWAVLRAIEPRLS